MLVDLKKFDLITSPDCNHLFFLKNTLSAFLVAFCWSNIGLKGYLQSKFIYGISINCEIKKMTKVVFIFFLLVQLASGEIDWRILDKLKKCLPNERFNYISYIYSQESSDETFYRQLNSLENNPSKLVGIHNRY